MEGGGPKGDGAGMDGEGRRVGEVEVRGDTIFRLEEEAGTSRQALSAICRAKDFGAAPALDASEAQEAAAQRASQDTTDAAEDGEAQDVWQSSSDAADSMNEEDVSYEIDVMDDVARIAALQVGGEEEEATEEEATDVVLVHDESQEGGSCQEGGGKEEEEQYTDIA